MGACLGKAMDSRLKMSGMTEGIENVGDDRGGVGDDGGGLKLLGMAEGESCGPAYPSCHSRRFLAGIQSCSFLSVYSWGLLGKSHGFPIKNVGDDGGGLKTSGMTEGAWG